jgi:hypothetical protein
VSSGSGTARSQSEDHTAPRRPRFLGSPPSASGAGWRSRLGTGPGAVAGNTPCLWNYPGVQLTRRWKGARCLLTWGSRGLRKGISESLALEGLGGMPSLGHARCDGVCLGRYRRRDAGRRRRPHIGSRLLGRIASGSRLRLPVGRAQKSCSWVSSGYGCVEVIGWLFLGRRVRARLGRWSAVRILSVVHSDRTRTSGRDAAAELVW